MLEKEKSVKSEKIYDGKIIKVRVDSVEVVQNGNMAIREIVEHPGGVGIAAVNDSGEICLVRQYRRPFDDFVTEIPAGKLEWGENHRDCGMRELREETGCSAESFIYLGGFYSSPGFCSEIIHLYLARGLTAGENDLDEDEFVETEWRRLDEAVKMVMDNEIKDAKTAVAILKADAYIKSENINK